MAKTTRVTATAVAVKKTAPKKIGDFKITDGGYDTVDFSSVVKGKSYLYCNGMTVTSVMLREAADIIDGVKPVPDRETEMRIVAD